MLDQKSGISFLIDTGAEVSIVLPAREELKRPPNRSLIAANGTPIRSYGTRSMALYFNQSKFTWRFQVAEAHLHIIGADFLRAHGLVVDLTNRRLVCLADLGVLKGVLKSTHAIKITSLTKNQDNEFAKLLHDRPELTTPTFALNHTQKKQC